MAGTTMNARSDREWAELARQLERDQLALLQRKAEGWRNGLTALTGLLAALAVIKGTDSLAALSPGARGLAMGLTAAAFVLLVIGSVLAVRASHGRWDKIPLGGQNLRLWTEQEIPRVRLSLQWASVCCVLGVGLVAGGVAVTWANTSTAPSHLVTVETTTGLRCGELVGMGPGGVELRVEQTVQRIPPGSVGIVTPINGCP